MSRLYLLLCTLVLCLNIAAADDHDMPHLTIPRAAGPIAVDGHLDEPAWSAAPIVDHFVYPWFEEGTKERTEVRLLWDDEALYVAFSAYDSHVSAQFTERDSPVSRDDCVEVFIAPDTAAVHNYFNFEFNALGTILDRSPRDKRSGTWNATGVQVAVAIHGTLNDHADQDSLWITEIALPFASFTDFAPRLPPAPQDVWRLNLYRTGGQINLQYAAWSHTQTPKPQFHAPERFGFVRFSAQKALLATPNETKAPPP